MLTTAVYDSLMIFQFIVYLIKSRGEYPYPFYLDDDDNEDDDHTQILDHPVSQTFYLINCKLIN